MHPVFAHMYNILCLPALIGAVSCFALTHETKKQPPPFLVMKAVLYLIFVRLLHVAQDIVYCPNRAM